jgi:hypothetical protein
MIDLTPEERALVEQIGEVFNALGRLPQEHPADLTEAQIHVHALQNIVLARPAYRLLKYRDLTEPRA